VTDRSVSAKSVDIPSHAPTIHASAVLVGARALLIRGPAGAGKSQLALDLLQAAASGRLAFARLVADDRVHVAAAHGRLVAQAPASLAGLLEIRGIGIRRLPHEPMAVVRLVVDLATAAERMPQSAAMEVEIEGVQLPRLAVAPEANAFSLVLAALTLHASRLEESQPGRSWRGGCSDV
jgi:serine kinase of HPr protein (carbohydrate metabolism regulator)